MISIHEVVAQRAVLSFFLVILAWILDASRSPNDGIFVKSAMLPEYPCRSRRLALPILVICIANPTAITRATISIA